MTESPSSNYTALLPRVAFYTYWVCLGIRNFVSNFDYINSHAV